MKAAEGRHTGEGSEADEQTTEEGEEMARQN